MSQRLPAIPTPLLPWYRHAGKVVMAAASTGAGLVSIFTFLYSYGVVGESESHKTIGNLGAAWVGVQPRSDTASAVGDTLHLAATITDRNGAVLVGARPLWTSDHPEVAEVLADGSVIAKGPGRSTVTVAVGTLTARAQVLVRPRVATVEVAAEKGDSTIVVPEDGRRPLRARGLDVRGHAVHVQEVVWRADDSTVAAVDSTGAVSGVAPGRTIVTATIAGVQGHAAVTVAPAPAALVALAGGSQWAPAGEALPQQVLVRVTSRRDRAVEGVLVRFRLADGAGRVAPEAALTDADGRVRAAWTLGALPGRQTLLASVDNVDSALTIVAEAEPVAANTRVAPLAESPMAAAGERLPAPAGVRLTDSTGRALVGVPVTWTALDGGVAEAVDARTDSTGAARVNWTLGPRAGAQRLRAQVGAGRGADPVKPVTLTADALPGAPASLVAVSGDAQRGTAGAALARTLVVRAVDGSGNGVAGVALALAPSAGSVPDTVAHTDSTGTARVRWTLGRAAGEQELAVRVAGLAQPLKLTARAAPGAAANIAFDDASSGRGAHKVAALVTDEFGNPVADVRVRLTASAGRVTPERAVTDAKGRVSVTWQPGPRGGEQTLTARVLGRDVVAGQYVVLVSGGAGTRAAKPSLAPTAPSAKPTAKPAARSAKPAAAKRRS